MIAPNTMNRDESPLSKPCVWSSSDHAYFQWSLEIGNRRGNPSSIIQVFDQYVHPKLPIVCKYYLVLSRGEGGTHIGRWYGDMPPSRPHFSGQILAPETHLFKPFFPLQSPHLDFFFKSCISSPILSIFSSWDTNFSKNLFRRPNFKPKKSVPETLFLKARAARTYPNFWWLPPPLGVC